MYQMSDACRQALTGDHSRSLVAEVFEGFGRMLASTYSDQRLEIDTSGQIRLEYQAEHCRSFQATILDTTGVLVPDDDVGLLDPVTRPQVQLWFDIGWEDDAGSHTERIPAGRYMLDTNTITEMGGDGVQMDITGNSRSSTVIQDNAWLQPYQMLSGVTWDAAIMAALVDRIMPGWQQQFRFQTSRTIMPLGVQLLPDESSSPWKDLQAMAVSDATELLEDALGAFWLRTPPDIRKLSDADACWSYTEDPTSSSHEVGAKRAIDISEVKNGAIVNGSAPWLVAPVQGVAWDDDPGSSTYYLGPCGRRAQTFDDETVGDETQADAVAEQKLSTILGVSEKIDFETIPNPGHDPGDVVKVELSASKVSALVVLQSLVIPFDVKQKMPVTISRVRK